MFFSNPLVIAGIVIFAVIFLAGVTFWIIFGINKFKWALITSIVLSALFVLAGGMFGLRAISPKLISAGRPFGRVIRIERPLNREEFNIPGYGRIFDFRNLPGHKGPEIKFEGIEKEDLQKIREHWDEIKSITVNVNVDVEYKE